MALITTWRNLRQRRQAEREFDDEAAFHLEMETEANIARGMSREDARLTALRSFGGVVQARENVRDARALRIESLWLDARYAARALMAQPRFICAAAGMLALAIGISTAMFTIIDALILRPVPFRDPAQLAHIWMGTDRGGRTVVSPAVLNAWRESAAFEAAESAMPGTVLLQAGETVVARESATVTPGIFKMLSNVRALRGRLFDPTDGRPGQTDRVLVSETLWRTVYGSDPAFVGSSITVDGNRLSVVGILPSEFKFPSARTVLWRPTDLAGSADMAKAYVRFAANMARSDALRLATEAARTADGNNAQLRPWVYPLAGLTDTNATQSVRVLAGGVVLVFLVLCANVCGLLLARLTARRREFAMRAALGASRGRLLRQALAESVVLAAAGMAGGAVVAWAFVSVSQQVIPETLLLQTLNPLTLDARAILMTSAFGVVAILVSGLLPAWLGTSVHAGDSLRVVDRGATEAPAARIIGRTLVTIEVALACTLLVGATLLTRSFVKMSQADRGLQTDGITTVWLTLGSKATTDPAARTALARSLDDELRQLPGVRQVAWSYGLPPHGGMLSFGDWISDLPGALPVNLTLERYVVTPELFALYQIPIVRGRGFTSSDTFSNVIISQALASRLWGEGDPVGHSFRFIGETFYVVGVAREIHFPSLDPRADVPEFYHPYTEVSFTPMVSLRCEPGCPDTAVIRHRLAISHPAVRVQAADTVDSKYVAELARPRAAAAVALTFAVFALTATAAGLFSVLSYAVTRRRREFGIRTALGATPRRVRQVVLRDGLIVATTGLALGTLFAITLSGALRSLQYGVTSSDPLSWAIVLAVVAVTTLAASWFPARSAARLDPLVLLREE
ncbi:MAG TPA: FtsX-like permease family protein [Vicinamibacterales bacterium]|nr:FtsX-like permease family protein [Vicinamibacterales bacterium]